MRRLIGLALALVIVSATPALAHVSVSPGEVEAGSFTKLTFRVPNESDTESTVAIEVVFPEAAPFRSVSVKPVPGWTHEVERAGDTVTRITWSGGEIGPGEFMEFDVSVGPVPEVDVLEFKTLQTYGDGEVVRWIDSTVEGEDEPEHPAPTAIVSGGDDAEEGDDHGEGLAEDTGETPDDAADGTDPAAFASLVVGGAALVAAVAALVMARKRPPA